MVALGNAHALLRGEGHPSPRGDAVGHLSDDGRRRAAADALQRRQLPHLPLLPRTFHLGREPESLSSLFLYRARTGHTPHAALRPARCFMLIAGSARLLNLPRHFYKKEGARGTHAYSAIIFPNINHILLYAYRNHFGYAGHTVRRGYPRAAVG